MEWYFSIVVTNFFRTVLMLSVFAGPSHERVLIFASMGKQVYLQFFLLLISKTQYKQIVQIVIIFVKLILSLCSYMVKF